MNRIDYSARVGISVLSQQDGNTVYGGQDQEFKLGEKVRLPEIIIFLFGLLDGNDDRGMSQVTRMPMSGVLQAP
jgi:hypothetical protein